MNKKRYAVSISVIAVVCLTVIVWNVHPRSDKGVVQTSSENVPEKLLPPKIKQAVNQALAPSGITYPKIENEKGITIDVSKRAVSVSTAVIDDKGQMHIVDYTSPIKE